MIRRSECQSKSLKRSSSLGLWFLLYICFCGPIGCDDDLARVQRLEQRHQVQQDVAATVDHLEESLRLIRKLDQVNLESATSRIGYHLNTWDALNRTKDTGTPPSLLETWSNLFPEDQALSKSERFQSSDVEYFRWNYLMHQIHQWIQKQELIDPLILDWIETEKSELSPASHAELKLACHLFDWTVRNVRLEPLDLSGPTSTLPEFPDGLPFQGAGYRQTTFQTLWRGTGDWLQRANVFVNLCRHAGLKGCILGLPSATQSSQEWMVSVCVDGRLYLFSPEFGIPVPGPKEKGIATLDDARQDASVLRRLRVPGVFDYPLKKQSVQKSIALLVATPEMLSNRMRRLQNALSGEDRINLYLDADKWAKQLEAMPGISEVRLWNVPILARRYQHAIQTFIEQDRDLAYWHFTRWAVLSRGTDLSRARWAHLQGNFSGDQDQPGARKRYVGLRHPEYELKNLQWNVDMQIKYGVQRVPEDSPETYARKVHSFQALHRRAKQMATYWLALLHVENKRWKPAETWLQKRVLEDPKAAYLHPACRYELARLMERQGNIDRAIELYKFDGDPQEHGNRIRARFLKRSHASKTDKGV